MSKGGIVGSAQSGADKYRRRLLAAAGLSNNLLFSNLNTTITIKSAPPKTAEETARLGIISGFLTKRNEQHSWQRRFCTLVPHSLLYYFEDEEADAPRGTIDLEYYTDVTAQPNNVIRLAASSSSENNDDATFCQQRTFYFQADSEEEMNAWMSALIRERYFVLRDERDAYQELQHDFQTQTDEMANVMRTVEAETKGMTDLEARVLREEAELADQLAELLNSVQSTSSNNETQPPNYQPENNSFQNNHQQQFFTIGAIRKDALEALASAGGHLKQRVANLEQLLIESKKGAAAADRELKEYQNQVQALTEAFDLEQKALAAEQRAKQQARENVETLRRELDEAQVNLGIIEGTRDTTESRVTELSEQKKLLVREVKAARKLLAEKQDLLKKKIATNQYHKAAEEINSQRSSSPPPNAVTSFISQAMHTAATAQSIKHQAFGEGGDDSASDLSTDDDALVGDTDATAVPPLAMDWPGQRDTQNSNKNSSFLLGGLGMRNFLQHNSLNVPPLITTSRKKKKTSLLSTEDNDRFVIRCRRCKGTVEGPKNSTCKCIVPLVGDQPEGNTSSSSDAPAAFITKSFGAIFGGASNNTMAKTSSTYKDTAQQQAHSSADNQDISPPDPAAEDISPPVPPTKIDEDNLSLPTTDNNGASEYTSVSAREEKKNDDNCVIPPPPTTILQKQEDSTPLSPASSNAASSGGDPPKNLVKL